MIQEQDKEEKAQELADVINSIKMPIFLLDLEFAKEAAKDMRNRASWEDSAAVLNPMYNPLKSSIICKQATALGHLISYVEALKEVDAMKQKLLTENKSRDDVMKMFM